MKRYANIVFVLGLQSLASFLPGVLSFVVALTRKRKLFARIP